MHKIISAALKVRTSNPAKFKSFTRPVFHIPGISVGIVTRYVLNGLEIKFRGRRDFPQPSRPGLGSTHPPVLWVKGIFPEGKTYVTWR